MSRLGPRHPQVSRGWRLCGPGRREGHSAPLAEPCHTATETASQRAALPLRSSLAMETATGPPESGMAVTDAPDSSLCCAVVLAPSTSPASKGKGGVEDRLLRVWWNAPAGFRREGASQALRKRPVYERLAPWRSTDGGTATRSCAVAWTSQRPMWSARVGYMPSEAAEAGAPAGRVRDAYPDGDTPHFLGPATGQMCRQSRWRCASVVQRPIVD